MRYLHTIAPGLATLAALTLAAGAASAHTGVGPTSGIAAGLAHPILGLDHLAAMLAAGLWAGQLGGRARWALPLSFLGLIAAGMALAAIVPALGLAELAIFASIVALGLLVALEIRLPVAAAALVVGLFALVHGHAHGAEMPATAGGLGYALGVLATTAALLAGGLGLHRRLGRIPARIAGALALLSGAALGLAG